MSFRSAKATHVARGLSVAQILALALLVALSSQARPGFAEEEKKPAGTSRGRIYALLIGCTEYPEFKKTLSSARYEASILLGGCENDVALMQKTLIERLGARAEDIVTLSGWKADAQTRPTAANVRAALEALSSRTYKPGDRVIVHYSGHGVQQPDDNDDETDGYDEAWLVADAHKAPKVMFAGTLRDEEIGKHLEGIRKQGATVWCVMDCCHSATGTRGAAQQTVRYRGFDPKAIGVEMEPARKTRGVMDSHDASPMNLGEDGRDGIIAFYAAQSFQKVPEVTLPRGGPNAKSYGLLTTCIVRALSRGLSNLSFGELYEQVVAGYRDLGVHHEVQPYAEGDFAMRVQASDSAVGVPLFIRKVERRTLELSAGALHGLAVGTELDVYASGKLGEKSGLLGRVVVHRMRAETAGVLPVKGTDTAWAKGDALVWPARIAKYVVGDTALPISVVDAADKLAPTTALAESTRGVLEDEAIRARFPPAKRLAEAKWLLVVGTDGLPVALKPARRGLAGPLFEVTNASLMSRLLGVYRGENLLRLAGRAPDMGLPDNFKLRVRRLDQDRKWKRVRSGERVTPGSYLDFGLVKEEAFSRDDLEVVDTFVFWIDPHYGIEMLYPTRQSGPRLSADDVTPEDHPIRVGHKREQTSDASQGMERLLIVVAPTRADAPHLDLSFLQQKPMQVLKTRGAGGGAMNNVSRLMNDLAFGRPQTRGSMVPVDRGATRLRIGVFTFETRWGAIRIPAADKEQPAVRIEPGVPAAKPGQAPEAWRLGPDVHYARAGRKKTWCLLVGRGPDGVQVLLDLDGQVEPAQLGADGLRRVVKERAFDAEMAIRIEADRIVAWYDRDDDGTFDLVLIDGNKDHRAEERFVLTADGWRHDRGIDAPVLGTGHLEYMRQAGGRAQAIDRLTSLAGD